MTSVSSLRFRAALVLLAAGLALPLAGCFEIEQKVELKKDLSGTAAFQMKVDFEPMIPMMAQMQKSMTGGEGPLTEEELAAARQQLLAQRAEEKRDPELEKAELAANMPEGLKLLDADFKDEGLKMTARFEVAFDHIDKLSQLSMDDEEEGEDNPVGDPFSDLRVVEEGSDLLLTSAPLNPAESMEEQTAGAPEEMAEFFEQAFSGLRFRFELTAPFEVVEHNATEKKGDTLIWDYDLAAMQKLESAGATAGIRVRFRR